MTSPYLHTHYSSGRGAEGARLWRQAAREAKMQQYKTPASRKRRERAKK